MSKGNTNTDIGISKPEDEFCTDLAEFTASVYKRFCPRCGAPVGYPGCGRPRVYCSDRCRWAANKAGELKRKKMMRQLIRNLAMAVSEDTVIGKAGIEQVGLTQTGHETLSAIHDSRKSARAGCEKGDEY